MKYGIFIFISVAFLAVGCKKNQSAQSQDCYVCQSYDSIYSNIPNLMQASLDTSTVTHCEITADLMRELVLESNYSTTLYKHGDTTEVEYHVLRCPTLP